MEDLAGSQAEQAVLREGQPISRRWIGFRVDPQFVLPETGQGVEENHVFHWTVFDFFGNAYAVIFGVRPAEMGRIAAEANRKLLAQGLADRRLGGLEIIRGQEEHQARAPHMVARGGGIQPDHIRPVTDQRGRMAQAGEMPVQDRPDGFPIIGFTQFNTRDKFGHSHLDKCLKSREE